jgi:hypothetical protein
MWQSTLWAGEVTGTALPGGVVACACGDAAARDAASALVPPLAQFTVVLNCLKEVSRVEPNTFDYSPGHRPTRRFVMLCDFPMCAHAL